MICTICTARIIIAKHAACAHVVISPGAYSITARRFNIALSLARRGPMISELQSPAKHQHLHMVDDTHLAPYELGSGIVSDLKRFTYQHRHNFHYLRRIQWEIIESYLEPSQGEYIL